MGALTMKEQFHHLSFEVLDDGTIRLEQRDYCGESVLIDLHPAQLEYIAHSVRPNAPNEMTERITTLERRLCWLRDRFEEIRAAAPSDMFDFCSEAFEFDAWIQASIDVADEYCADLVSVAVQALDDATPVAEIAAPPCCQTNQGKHMNITKQSLKATENALRNAIVSRLIGANRTARIAEAKRLFADRAERVEALRRLIAIQDAAGFSGCAGGADVVGHREQLAVELADLERLQNVVSIFDELFQEDRQ